MKRAKSGAFGVWITLCSILALLLILNLPFYSGSTLGKHARWRMEHGRFTFRWGPDAGATGSQGFWVDLNSEGLRWKPEYWGSWRDGSITIPIWMLLAGAAAGAILSRRGTCKSPVSSIGDSNE